MIVSSDTEDAAVFNAFARLYSRLRLVLGFFG